MTEKIYVCITAIDMTNIDKDEVIYDLLNQYRSGSFYAARVCSVDEGLQLIPNKLLYRASFNHNGHQLPPLNVDSGLFIKIPLNSHFYMPTQSNVQQNYLYQNAPSNYNQYPYNAQRYLQSQIYWAGIANNACGYWDNFVGSYKFLIDNKIIYPEIYPFTSFNAAQNYALNCYHWRYRILFPNLGVNQFVPPDINQIYYDDQYEVLRKQNVSTPEWDYLIKQGLFHM